MASARHRARVLARQAAVLLIRSVRSRLRSKIKVLLVRHLIRVAYFIVRLKNVAIPEIFVYTYVFSRKKNIDK